MSTTKKPVRRYTEKRFKRHVKIQTSKPSRTERTEYRGVPIFVEGDTYRVPAFISSTRYKSLASAKKAIDRYKG